MRIVVIGGVAAGMSAASQAKRRMPDAEVIALERGAQVSYGACGMPYNIEKPERDIEDLVVMSAKTFRDKRGIDVRTRHEVLSIDTEGRTVEVRDHGAGSTYELSWDRLVIATGAHAIRLDMPGMDEEGVFPLRDLEDGAAVKRWLADKEPGSAVILGGGYIGMEMAEVLRSRGLAVTVVEMADQVVPGFEPQIARIVREELERHEVRVETGAKAQAVEREDGRLVLVTDKGRFSADLVLVAVGVKPSVALAEAAGIALGETGAIAVDRHMRTSAEDVYAAGDCAEDWHRVSGHAAWVPLGTTANKQGKVAGANAVGAEEAFAGIVGTAVFKVFGLEVGRTGLGAKDIERFELDAVAAPSKQPSRAESYAGGTPVTTVVFAERGTGSLLGAQMVAREGVAGRIDTFATALYAELTVEDVENLDLAYAPPFAPVYDPVLIAATVARKALASDA
ncbi:MAG: FAD-dependent oxidoreductase [Deltaproteobacteria bacterium]|nr:FAD-dependent oxidoreductase [Deltaproteobacteria bacterium]MCB9785115.1 FAD-dependent oxidoreductase [Deltaproteobacteria bacterium]